MTKYFTLPVIIAVLVGLLCIITGQAKFIGPLINPWWQEHLPIDEIIKTVGLALIGSGVFTTILKTREYTQLFNETLQRNLYSDESLAKREDKAALWKTLTRMLYNNKFADIRDDLESMIIKNYFYLNSNWYVTNYDITLNMSNHASPDFWMQSELIKLTVIPADKETLVDYTMTVGIDRPISHPNDLTSCVCNNATINNKPIASSPSSSEPNRILQTINCKGQNEQSYQIVVDRTKVLCKAANPQKTFVANQIIKNMTVTLIHDVNMTLDFRKAGTINEFNLVKDQKNGATRFRTWVYDGLILPHQGYIIVFK